MPQKDRLVSAPISGRYTVARSRIPAILAECLERAAVRIAMGVNEEDRTPYGEKPVPAIDLLGNTFEAKCWRGHADYEERMGGRGTRPEGLAPG